MLAEDEGHLGPYHLAFIISEKESGAIVPGKHFKFLLIVTLRVDGESTPLAGCTQQMIKGRQVGLSTLAGYNPFALTSSDVVARLFR
jgi:hypothetical protein